MSSKKKTKGKNNRNTRKQTVIHYPRNLTILCIIAVLFGMIVYHSLNVYSQESILEYPGEQSVAGYTVADNNYHIEDADTHYIDYTFDDRAIRVLWLNLSAEAAVDTNFQVQSFYNDEKVESFGWLVIKRRRKSPGISEIRRRSSAKSQLKSEPFP